MYNNSYSSFNRLGTKDLHFIFEKIAENILRIEIEWLIKELSIIKMIKNLLELIPVVHSSFSIQKQLLSVVFAE